MNFEKRLRKIEDKIEVSDEKIICISNIKDLIEYAHKKLSDDTKVIIDDKISEMLKNTARLRS